MRVKEFISQYEIERRLANRLRMSTCDERKSLYRTTYDELFRCIPNHPLTRKKSKHVIYKSVNNKLRLFKHFLNREVNYVEIGPGDCALALTVSKFVKHVYAIDVSKEIVKKVLIPSNFTLVLSDGSSIPVPNDSIHVAFSCHLMEHLHPDDASLQLKNIYTSLAYGGKYICITPNKLTGPHDISRYFSDTAKGLHLKEYTNTEMNNLFRQVGFSNIRFYAGGKGLYMRFPLQIIIVVEKMLLMLPTKVRKWITRNVLMQAALGINIVGFK